MDEELTDVCAICSEEYSEINAKITLKCKHEFCESCITKWINKSNTCPTCRRSTTLFDLEDAINRSESILYLEERNFMKEGVPKWKLIDLISPFNEVYKKQQELLKKHSESLEKLYLIDTYIKTKGTKYDLQSLVDAVENEKDARDQVKANLSYLPFLLQIENNIFTQRLYNLYTHIINAQTLATQACIMFIVTSITYYIHSKNNSTESILFKYWFDAEGNNGLNEKDNLEKIKSTLNEAIKSVLLAKDHVHIVNRILNKSMRGPYPHTSETDILIGIIHKIENAEVISQMNISDALFSLKEFIVRPQMESYEHYSLQTYTKRFEQIEAIEALITTIEDETKAQITIITESVQREKKFTVSWLQNKNKTKIAELTKLQKELKKQKEELSTEKRLRSNWDGEFNFEKLEEKVTKRDALQAQQAQQAQNALDALQAQQAQNALDALQAPVGGLRTTKRRRTKQLATKRRRTKQVATKRQRTKQLATKRQRITKKK